MKNKIKNVLLTAAGIILMPVGVFAAVAIAIVVWTLLASVGILPNMESDVTTPNIVAFLSAFTVVVSAFLFYRTGHKEFDGWVSLALFPQWKTLVSTRAGKWADSMPDWTQPGIIGFGAITLVVLPYMIIVMAAIYFLGSSLAIFASGWYFCWLTMEVKAGRIKFWPWLVDYIRKTITTTEPETTP